MSVFLMFPNALIPLITPFLLQKLSMYGIKLYWNGLCPIWIIESKLCFVTMNFRVLLMLHVAYHRGLFLDHFYSYCSLLIYHNSQRPPQFVICRNLWSRPWRGKLIPITLKTCSVYLGEYPCSLLKWIGKIALLLILVLFHWYICLYVYISYNAHKWRTKETFLKGSDVYVNVFSVLGSIPSGTIDINLTRCVLSYNKLRHLQIATNRESLLSQFVIRRNWWSRRDLANWV